MKDLISRAAALEALGECPYNWNDWPEEIQAVDDWESHKEAIENIPAVDAVPVMHGWWIKSELSAWPIMMCSACGEPFISSEKTKFCPHCGAKMDSKRRIAND